MKLPLDKVTRVISCNPMRNRAYITLLTDATVYLSKVELESPHEFENNQGFPIKLYGVHEVRGYLGEIFAVSDTADADIRIIEY